VALGASQDVLVVVVGSNAFSISLFCFGKAGEIFVIYLCISENESYILHTREQMQNEDF
jgi:hypothetical protein